MIKEEWRDIHGYEGKYQVSNMGRIRTLSPKNRVRNSKNGIITTSLDNCGYKNVTLSGKTYKVHRLVAIAFIENIHQYPCINHKDENKENNRVDNLEWCSYKYNCNYGTRNLRISQNGGRKIVQMDMEGNDIQIWNSIAQAARFFGVKRTTICGCCAGRQHTSCGYKWRYADE